MTPDASPTPSSRHRGGATATPPAHQPDRQSGLHALHFCAFQPANYRNALAYAAPGCFHMQSSAAPAPGQARPAQGEPPSGRVAEWSNAPVLKTGDGQPSVGSNPTPSAIPEQNCSIRMHKTVAARSIGPFRGDRRAAKRPGPAAHVRVCFHMDRECPGRAGRVYAQNDDRYPRSLAGASTVPYNM